MFYTVLIEFAMSSFIGVLVQQLPTFSVGLKQHRAEIMAIVVIQSSAQYLVQSICSMKHIVKEWICE